MHTVCIDFGTSSLRAAIRRRAVVEPLAIAPGSPIDNASIPSAIYIPESRKEICFGVDALKRGQAENRPFLFEQSPKSWLTPDNIGSLDSPAASGLPFTRRNLLCALLSLSVDSTLKCAKLSDKDPYELRISHPSWSAKDRKKLGAEYESLRQAVLMRRAPAIKQVMPVSEFADWCGDAESGSVRVSVEEPVAAALSVLDDVDDNRASVLLAVDIGAGTIDLGYFSFVAPDSSLGARLRLLNLVDPISIFGAGDKIDGELLDIFVRKGRLNLTDEASVRNRIREYKENIFEGGTAAFGRITVERSELMAREALSRMARDLECQITRMVGATRESLSKSGTVPLDRFQFIHVVFSGGGADLEFLTDAVMRGIAAVNLGVDVKTHIPGTFRNHEVEASRARMAVALGGVVEDKYWPETDWKNAVHLKGLHSIKKSSI